MSQHHRSDKKPALPMVTSVITFTIGASGIWIVDSHTVVSESGEQPRAQGVRDNEEGAPGTHRRAVPAAAPEWQSKRAR